MIFYGRDAREILIRGSEMRLKNVILGLIGLLFVDFVIEYSYEDN